MEYSAMPYYEKLGVNPDDYKNISLSGLGFSNRLSTRLDARQLITVADLLKVNEASLREIKGFGKGCFDEINNYFKTIKDISFKKTNRKSLTPELCRYIERILNNDFSFLRERDFSEESLEVILFIQQGFELLDYNLIEGAINGTPEVINLLAGFKSFIDSLNVKEECRRRIQTIPKCRREIEVDWLISIFSKNEEIKEYLLKQKTKEHQKIEDYICSNTELVIAADSMLIQFITWCTFDVKNEIQSFFDKMFEDQRLLLVIRERSNKATLETVGNMIGVTRERVRQIEAKATKKFRLWESRSKSLLKIFTDFKEDTALSSVEIEEYLGEYGKFYLYFMKFDAASFDDCAYDKQLDLFIVEGNSMIENIQQYVENLPETFTENKLKEILIASDEYEYPRKLVITAINESYRKTGEVYHRTRLTLTNVYADVMKNHYPEGMHIYDDKEIDKFKEIVKEEYGIELTQKNRAIVSGLSRVGILCGRGRYRLNDKEFISKGLAVKIHDYIAQSDSPIFMTNTLFSVFEDELVTEGIDNKYFLQGVLHELYGEEWYFKRDYVSKDEGFTSVYSGIVAFIKKSQYPVRKEEIFKAFPGVTDIVVNIAVSDPEILNLFGSYIHGSKLKLDESDIIYLKKTVDWFLEKKDVWHCKHIYEFIQNDYPSLLTNNYVSIPFCMYSLLEYCFKDDYNFSRPYIAANDAEIERTYDVLKEMIQESDLMYISDILVYARTNYHQINSILDFLDTCNDTHLLISADEIASIDLIGVTEDIAREIENIIIKEVTETMPVSHLQCVHKFPEINVKWNEWLIYSIIKKWGTKLEVIPSANQFRQAIPLIAIKGYASNDGFTDMSSEKSNGIALADDLSNIDDLIGDYILEGMD